MTDAAAIAPTCSASSEVMAGGQLSHSCPLPAVRTSVAAWFAPLLPLTLAAVVLVGAPGSAGADVGSMYGVGSAGVARAGQSVATPRGDAASLHNVAALAATGSTARVGFTGALHAMRIDRRCTSATTCLKARAPAPSRALTAGWSGKVHDRVGLGVTFSTPVTELVRVTAPDPRRPHAPMLEGIADRFALYAGTGIRLLPWLELGIGAQVHAQLASKVVLDLDPVHKRIDRADVEIHLGPDIGATIGLRAHTPGHLTWALTWHQAAAVPYTIPAEIGVDGIGAVRLQLAQLAHSTPHRFELAAAWRDTALVVEVGVRWQRWSLVKALGPDLQSDVGGGIIDGVGLGRAIDINAPASGWSPALSDTFSVAVSTRWQAREQLVVRGGWRYRPSPFPEATASAALLDSDAHILATGLALQVEGWEFGAGGQIWLWQTRRPTSGSVASHRGATVVSSLDITRRF